MGSSAAAMEGTGYRVSAEEAFFRFCLYETPPRCDRLLPQAVPGLWEPG